MSVVTAAWRGGSQGRPGWWLAFTYSAATIAALKVRIPAADRTWDPEAKTWWVAVEHADTLAELLPSFTAFLQQAPLF